MQLLKDEAMTRMRQLQIVFRTTRNNIVIQTKEKYSEPTVAIREARHNKVLNLGQVYLLSPSQFSQASKRHKRV